jgi:hypothetical protein
VSDLTRREDRSPIPGWKIDSSGLVASTRWHYSWPIAWAFAAIWNLGLPHLVLSQKQSPPDSFVWIGDVAAIVFAILAVRAFFTRTVIRFTARELRVENALAPWQRYRVDLAEIKAFQVIQDPNQGHAYVGVEVAAGAVQPLPIDWQPLYLSFNGSKKRVFIAPLSSASWMATALTDMLTKARLLGHDTYRS